VLSTINQAAAAAATTSQGFNISDLLFPLLMVFVIYMMWNSGRKRKRAALELKNSLAVGTEVVLHSGITGKIVALDDVAAVIETTPKTKIRVLLGAIRGIDTSVAQPVVEALAADDASETK
jgi:preprotein translocase subunit YajC